MYATVADRRRLLHVRNPVLHEPVIDFKEEERREKRDKVHVELLAEHGHRQAHLRDCIPRRLIKRLDLRIAEPAEEESLAVLQSWPNMIVRTRASLPSTRRFKVDHLCEAVDGALRPAAAVRR